MVAGIVFFAFALETTLHHITTTLALVPAVALCAGTALYLIAQVASLWRSTGRIFRRRTLGAAVLLALIPAALKLPAVAALALVSTVCALVVAYEAIRYREHRSRIRHPELTG
jgi:low temperature requirement protein LtrA